MVRPGRSGKLLELVNHTGGPVTDVVMKLQGRAVGGMFGDPDWSQKVPLMEEDQYVEAVFAAAWGAPSDPPRVEIAWTDFDEMRQTALVYLPY